MANLQLKIRVRKWKQNGEKIPDLFTKNRFLKEKLKNFDIERDNLKQKLGNITLQMTLLNNLIAKYQEYRNSLSMNM
jgi:hypothetical protein